MSGQNNKHQLELVGMTVFRYFPEFITVHSGIEIVGEVSSSALRDFHVPEFLAIYFGSFHLPQRRNYSRQNDSPDGFKAVSIGNIENRVVHCPDRPLHSPPPTRFTLQLA